jgi:hypothetical protein
MMKARRIALSWLLLALSAGVCVYWFLHARGYWEDDAYIHLEFARSLSRGQGFSFNGHVVYGDTSPLWVWLLVAFHAAIPDWMAAGKALTAVAAVFALGGVYAFAWSLLEFRGRGMKAIFAATMVLVVVTTPYFGYWAFSGMEALAAAGLACWGAFAVAQPRLTTPRFLAAAFIAGLAPLLRPEMVFFTALMGLVLLLDLLQPRGWAESLRSPKHYWLCVAGGFFLITTPALEWAGYALRTFGSLLPNTDAAKRAGPADSVVSRLVHVYAFGYPVTVLAALLLGGWLLVMLVRRRGDELAVLWSEIHPGGWLFVVWTAVTCVFYVANHTYVQTRYIFITAPGLTVALLALACLRWPGVYKPLLTVALAYGAVVSVTTTRPLVANKVVIDRIYAELAAYIRALPPDAPVAHYSIGEAAFLSEHPLVDTGGITRPGIIPFLWDAEDDRRVAWMYGEGARYVVIGHSPTPGAKLLWSRELPEAGWTFNPRQYSGTDLMELWELPPR